MYYLATRPETVVSIITHGKLPNNQPSWLNINCLFCTNLVDLSFDGINTSHQQIFILELNIPSDKTRQEDFLFLEKIELSWINKIIVYSQQAENLLHKLFKENCTIQIIIEPDIYPKTALLGKKRPRSEISEHKDRADDFPGSPTKKLALLPNIQVGNNQINNNKTLNINLANNSIDRISTYAEHLELLKSAFIKARKTIFITTYSINHETLEKANLYELIPLAKQQGVKVYIYYNDQKDIDKRVSIFLKNNKVFCNETYTHSKILAVDNNLVATGSCNWLAIFNSKYKESDEGSLVIKGTICKDIIEDLWDYLKYYRNLQFENRRAVYEFEKNLENNSTIIYDLEKNTELGYLPTLDQHCGFFQACFEEAKQRIIICSPFISSAGEYQDDIDYTLLKNTVARGVSIYFICGAESDSLAQFRDFIANANLPKIQIITISNFHLKTIIIDNNMISEGSFNWLSAMRDDMSDHHNHEQTLYVKGNIAKQLIEKFFQSRVGMLIEHEIDSIANNYNNNVNYFPFFTNSVPSRPATLASEDEDKELQIAMEASLTEYVNKYSS